MVDLSFPKGFLWGAASASYQVEGGAAEGGRGPSIWDTFSHSPGKVAHGETGDVAVDHFHRFREDVKLMADLGLGAYRFSVSWSRVLPSGRNSVNAVNAQGLDFYAQLVDELLAHNIKPVLTMYHWDLPQPLEDAGGWGNRATAEAFGEYALVLAEAFGDRVPMWTTLNEPWCSAYLGYASGVHAPGRTEPETAFRAVHHLNLAHGLGAQALRSVVPDSTQLMTALNLHVPRPATESTADQAAVEKIDLVGNQVWLRPQLEGCYPEALFALTSEITDWSFIEDGDLKTIHQPLDILGLNFYNPLLVAHRPDGQDRISQDGHGVSEFSPWPGCEDVDFLAMPGPYTAMGWPVDPSGLTDLVLRVKDDYPTLPVVITENGAAYQDTVESDGSIHDTERTTYLAAHLTALRDAIELGADVRGYFAWSIMDNFEWAYGYDKRFGIVHVDFETQQRRVKDSGTWYSAVIAANALVPRPA